MISLDNIWPEYSALQKRRRTDAKIARETALVKRWRDTVDQPLRRELRQHDLTRKESPATPSAEQKQDAMKRFGNASGSAIRIPLPPPPHLPQPIPLFMQYRDYTHGIPNPAYHLELQPLAGSYPATAVAALADPTKGEISIGVHAGNTFDTAVPGEGDPIVLLAESTKLPDTWLFGDSIDALASLIFVADIAGKIDGDGLLIASAEVYNGATILPSSAGPLGFAATSQLIPGQPDSAGSGLVAHLGKLTLTATVIGNSGIQASNVEDVTFYQHAATRSVPGNLYGEINTLFEDWLFENYSIVELSTLVPITPTAVQVMLQVDVSLSGLRAGKADPKAGAVGMAFEDLSSGVGVLGYLPFDSFPFIVPRMAGSFIANL